VDCLQEFTIVMPRLSPARLHRVEQFQCDLPIPLRHSRQHARLPDAGHAVIRTNPDSGIGQKSISGIPSTQPSLWEAIEILAYDYLDETHMGWEVGEGSYGTFVFSVPKRTITLEHHRRYTVAHTTKLEI